MLMELNMQLLHKQQASSLIRCCISIDPWGPVTYSDAALTRSA